MWIDGQYVGYLKELKGDKKVLLLPGEHVISVRQNAYQNFTEQIQLQPGETRILQVAMQKAPTGELPPQWATVKISVHKIKIALPVYKTFESDINPTANQKVEVKTELVKSDVPFDDAALKIDGTVSSER